MRKSYQETQRQLDDLANAAARPPTLRKNQIEEILQNCVQLSVDNKITTKNAWDLKLIDHLHCLVEDMKDADDVGSSFQRAGCTLDAGVKIYSKRVDAVYEYTYNTMQGLSRSGANNDGDDDETEQPEGEAAQEQAEGKPKRKRARRFDDDVSATLAQPADINVDRNDAAFAVDPLFHYMTAKFNEGAVSGLLMNTLSMFGGCSLAFSSQAVPDTLVGDYAASAAQSQARQPLAHAWLLPQLAACAHLPVEAELCPSLREATSQASGEASADQSGLEGVFSSLLRRHAARAGEEGNQQAGDAHRGPEGDLAASCLEDQNSLMDTTTAGPCPDYMPDDACDPPAGGEGDGGMPFDDGDDGFWGGGGDDCADFADSGAGRMQGSSDGAEHSHEEGAALEDGLSKDAFQWLLHSGQSSARPASSSWAGAKYWKYHVAPTDAQARPKRAAKRVKEELAIDFDNPPEVDESVFKRADNEKALVLTAATLKTRVKYQVTLPEDHHIEARELFTLGTRPDFAIGVASERQRDDDARPVPGADWDDDGGWVHDGGDDGGDFGADENGLRAAFVGDYDSFAADDEPPPFELTALPTKVATDEVTYARSAKQVDVRVLKRRLWDILQRQEPAGAQQDGGQAASAVDFQRVIQQLRSGDGASLHDLSVHLCFICLLHLANEHGLAVTGVQDMDRLFVDNVAFV